MMRLSMVSMGWGTLYIYLVVLLTIKHKFNIVTFVYVVYAGRKKSLRSLEIPLENLLSGIIFLSGS